MGRGLQGLCQQAKHHAVAKPSTQRGSAGTLPAQQARCWGALVPVVPPSPRLAPVAAACSPGPRGVPRHARVLQLPLSPLHNTTVYRKRNSAWDGLLRRCNAGTMSLPAVLALVGVGSFSPS